MNAIIQNEPTDILAHYEHYREDAQLYHDIVTNSLALFGNVENIIYYIGVDAIISVKLRGIGKQRYRKEGVYDYVCNTLQENKKNTVSEIYKQTPCKLPIIEKILLQENFSKNKNIRLSKIESTLFEYCYEYGFAPDRVAKLKGVELSEVENAINKAINYFSDIYKLSKIVELKPEPIKLEPEPEPILN